MDSTEVVIKLTTLWAFSESVLGGFFHAFSIPFSGGLLTAIAAVIISMIAYFSEGRGEIFKATLIVLLVKAAVSPNSPLTAYFAVSVQGFFGEVFFYNKKFFKTSAVLFSSLVLLLTATQRILTLTILFGNNLWNSIDIYTKYVLKVLRLSVTNINVSFFIIGIFVLLHVAIGVLAGKFAAGMPEKIKNPSFPEDFSAEELKNYKGSVISRPPRKKKRKKIMRKIFYTVVIVLIVFSYLHPEFGKERSLDLVIMLARSITIIFLWVTLISPFLYKSIRKYLDKKEAPIIGRINRIIASFPYYRKILDYSFSRYRGERIPGRIKKTIVTFLALALFTELDS